MIRIYHTLFRLCECDVRRCPAEDPFCIFRFDIDTAMRTSFTKIIVPERAMNGNAVSMNDR